MSEIKALSIAQDFSEFPAGRFPKDGPFNGETFRKSLLVPALSNNETVEVTIDGVRGYGSSFLEEAFGGLVRSEGFKRSDLKSRLKILFSNTDFEIYSEEIEDYINSAVAE